jgi:hypothetical protein
MSDLYVIDQNQDWAWLTYAQMALWHAEDEEWLKARAAEAAAAERHYWSVEASTERLMAQMREIARLELMLEERRENSPVWTMVAPTGLPWTRSRLSFVL